MARFEWLGKARRRKPDGLYEMVVRQKPIGDATMESAEDVATRASAILAANRAEGHSRIVTSRGTHSDAFVNLDDSAGDGAAWAIEKGHMRKDGTFVQGVAPLGGAVGNL